MRRAALLSIIIAACCTLRCSAGVDYDAATRTVTVTGFDAGEMGALSDILEGDRAARWGAITYDDVTQTYTLDANLCIGAAEGVNTWFRIGTPEHPHEHLRIRGDLRVHEGKPTSGYQQFLTRNALWLGDAQDPGIRPTVCFDCEANSQYGLLVGDGAILRINNATITAATRDRQHMPRVEIAAKDVTIADSVFSWIDGPGMTHDFHAVDSAIRGTTFEHGPVGIYCGTDYFLDCTFRDLDVALKDPGGTQVTLQRCRFESNRRNWQMPYTPYGILAIDCHLEPPTEPAGPHMAAYFHPKYQAWQCPSFVALRHIVVRVTNAAGEPVAGARVQVTAEGDAVAAVHHGVALTGTDGRTPAPDQYGALLVSDYAYKVIVTGDGDGAGQHIDQTAYTYTISVSADGYRAATEKAVDPEQSWSEITIVLSAER